MFYERGLVCLTGFDQVFCNQRTEGGTAAGQVLNVFGNQKRTGFQNQNSRRILSIGHSSAQFKEFGGRIGSIHSRANDDDIKLPTLLRPENLVPGIACEPCHPIERECRSLDIGRGEWNTSINKSI